MRLCELCGTAETPRWIKGLCNSCYAKVWHEAHPGYRAQVNKRWRERNQESIQARNEARRVKREPRPCVDCGTAFVSSHAIRCEECRKEHRRRYERPRWAARRASKKNGDITPGMLAQMYARAKHCPSCRARLTDEWGPYQKHMDHILPDGVGGPWTVTNLRVLCRTCNLRRPKDGSDLEQLPLVWQV